MDFPSQQTPLSTTIPRCKLASDHCTFHTKTTKSILFYGVFITLPRLTI